MPRILQVASKAIFPRQIMIFTFFIRANSSAKKMEQLSNSSLRGLFCGGAHLTVAVIYAFFRLKPSASFLLVGFVANPFGI